MEGRGGQMEAVTVQLHSHALNLKYDGFCTVITAILTFCTPLPPPSPVPLVFILACELLSTEI